MTGLWVPCWAASPQLTAPEDLPPAPFTRDGVTLADSTLRQTVRVSAAGNKLRLRLCNGYGDAPLEVADAWLARPAGGRAGAGAIQPGSGHRVTFDGRASATVPAGGELLGDPVGFAVDAGDNVCVTMYLPGGLPAGGVTGHAGSRTTSHLAPGNQARQVELGGAAAVEHWYLIGGVEVWSPPSTAAAVMLGDSLTDGRGSTTDGNDRWPDRLLDRLRADPDLVDVAIVNAGIGGNRLLGDGLGPSGLSRLGREALDRTAVAWLVVFEGVNDIGTAEATEVAQRRVVDELIGAYELIARRARGAGIRVYGATISPFGGNETYDDAGGTRAASRRAVNDWIRTAGRFDATLDFDRAVRDPADPDRLLPGYDTGDHLHLNPAGYQALADAVPIGLFQGIEGSKVSSGTSPARCQGAPGS
jgi:lysophospholipase L1-like esterase